MSLFALPVSVADLTQLQQGIQFFTNTAEATAEAAAINADEATESVLTYAAKLIQSNISLSQVAMADTAIMEGGTIPIGDTTTPNTLTFLSTQFLPAQVATGIAHGFNGTVYAAEALGLALGSTAGFNTNFANLGTTAFVQAVVNAIGVNPMAIQDFLNNWIAFYSGAGSGVHPGLSVTQAAYGATFGDAIGVALLNPTSANLQTVVSTTPFNPFSPNTIQGLVANALIDNAEGAYKTGVALGALPPNIPLQGGGEGVPLFLTTGIDSPTKGFSNSPTGKPLLNGFTATNKGEILPAQPFVSTSGVAVVNDQDSLGTVQLGGIAQGLNTLLTKVNISGYGNNSAFSGAGTTIFAGIVAAGVADATKTINVNITGSVGTTNAAGADSLIFSNDTTAGNGTAANPKLSYGTWAITTSADSDLQLQQDFNGFVPGSAFLAVPGGVGGATGLTLNAAGTIAVGQDKIGNWQKVKDINAAGSTGTVIVTGATAGNATNAFGTTSNPLWLFGSAAGLLDDTGAGGAFALTSYELGSGVNVLDVSSASAAQIAKLTTTPNVTAGLNNTIIVQDSVATTTSAATFANIKGFQTLGIGGASAAQGAAGTINMANLPGFTTIEYFTAAAGSVNYQPGRWADGECVR
jgi:hypothetical protein